MAKGIATPTIIVNGENIGIVGNSVSYSDGFGEYTNLPQSAGGGAVEMVAFRNITTAMSSVKFSIFATAENLELIRTWKNRFNNNVIEIQDQTAGGAEPFSRSFTQAVLTNEVEVGLGTDAEIAVEWTTKPAT